MLPRCLLGHRGPSNESRREVQKGKIYGRYSGKRKDAMRCSDAELEMRLEDWIWGNRERRQNLQAAYQVFWQVSTGLI